jgi:hypothetical protein
MDNIFSIIFLVPHGCMATLYKPRVFILSNVPVVYDVFTVAIKECVSIPATVKMWWNEAWEPLGDLAE